jgi:hypothetical protein
MMLEVTDEENLVVGDDFITLRLGDQEEKAEHHQYGFFNKQAGRDVPARPIVRFTFVKRAQWRGWLADYLVNGHLP